MSKQLVSSIDIEAPASLVWEQLVDFGAFSMWNPFITSAEGPVEVGGRLALRMQPAIGSAITLRPRWSKWSRVAVFAGGPFRDTGIVRRPSVRGGAAR
jgi:hypothetical protein